VKNFPAKNGIESCLNLTIFAFTNFAKKSLLPILFSSESSLFLEDIYKNLMVERIFDIRLTMVKLAILRIFFVFPWILESGKTNFC
jgi:hypothetical protein